MMGQIFRWATIRLVAPTAATRVTATRPGSEGISSSLAIPLHTTLPTRASRMSNLRP